MPSDISTTEPDWTREDPTQWWDPGPQLLRSLRRYQKWRNRGSLLGFVISRWSVITYRFWSAVGSADIPLNCKLGGGLLLPHPTGVVLHPEADIGVNCLILQQVSIVGGAVLKGHVDVGAGAKVIKPVTIGEHAIIGANAVVVDDVAPGARVAGVPARPVG